MGSLKVSIALKEVATFGWKWQACNVNNSQIDQEKKSENSTSENLMINTQQLMKFIYFI